ncbi:MAG: alpha-mannosidase, partial [Clostridia bacterium]
MMKNIMDAMERLKGKLDDKTFYQLRFAAELNREMDLGLLHVLQEGVIFLENALHQKDAITRDDQYILEQILSPFAEKAKSIRIICTSHAHIDMNWMWGLNETVAITLDTFRTVLDLMEEYGDFTFSQSQASVYRIVEEYMPEMLPRIRQRIQEGRWEITASHWVEADKNMPDEESQIRHLTHTRRYLGKLFGLSDAHFDFDYEPDTFGHHRNLPEILSSSGVKYYYHCRGYDGHVLYNWQSPSGNRILVFKEPQWYNSAIHPDMALHAPGFCKSHGLDVMLKVYGCGDHGGGPTRKDIELLRQMATWPVFPTIQMGTYRDFYRQAEKNMDNFPVVEGELNFIFTGCYTSQSRIKAGNKISEARLNDFESACSTERLALLEPSGKDAFWEWNKVLFNHFHDILPGSGVIETREYAMAKYQEVLAFANTGTYEAYRNIAGNMDTLSLKPDEDLTESRSEGAGAGFNTGKLKITAVERGRGMKRLYHVFNSLPAKTSQVIELQVWDWPGNPDRLVLTDAAGGILPHQFHKPTGSDSFYNRYWQHKYFTLYTSLAVPSLGYATIILDQAATEIKKLPRPSDFRVEPSHGYVLENDVIRAAFNPDDLSLQSLRLLGSDTDLVETGSGVFRLLKEDPSRGMTSWIIGKHMDIGKASHVKVEECRMDRNALRQWIRYTATLSNSRINVLMSLDRGSACLDYQVECEWLETGKKNDHVPQLDFHVKCAYPVASYRYDIPFGTIDREPAYMNVPA